LTSGKLRKLPGQAMALSSRVDPLESEKLDQKYNIK